MTDEVVKWGRVLLTGKKLVC